MTDAPRVSVAIPLYNEAEGAAELLRRLGLVLDDIPGSSHEIVLVDDGSSDDTLRILRNAARADSRLTVVALSRNFGHQAALTAALDYVTGDVVILMDGDLQDPPEAISLFLEKFAEGFDVVYAVRSGRKESVWLRACYFLFYRLMSGLSGLRIPLDAGDFGLMSRQVVDVVRRAPERHRYLRGLRAWAGFRQVGVLVERHARVAGDSKYSVWDLLTLAFDGVFAFSVIPLRAATIVGVLMMTGSAVYTTYALYVRFILERSPPGFTALVVMLSFASGMILLFLGIIGEYVGRVYEEVKARPVYIVREVVGRD